MPDNDRKNLTTAGSSTDNDTDKEGDKNTGIINSPDNDENEELDDGADSAGGGGRGAKGKKGKGGKGKKKKKRGAKSGDMVTNGRGELVSTAQFALEKA